MTDTRPVADAADPTSSRTCLVIGFGTRPTAAPLSPDGPDAVGPVTRRHDLIRLVTDATADYVAVQHQPLPSRWVHDAVAEMEADPRIAAVVVTDVDTDPGTDVFAEVGPAIVVSTRAVVEVGGLHPPTPSSGPDGAEADLQWRLAARGYRIAPLPLTPEGSFPRRLPLATRLAVLLNNLEADSLSRILPALVVSAVTEPIRSRGVDATALDLQRSPGGDDVGTLPVDAQAAAGILEATQVAQSLPDHMSRRRWAQETRRVSDRVLAPRLVPYVEATMRQAHVSDDLIEGFPWSMDPSPRLRVVILSRYEAGTAGAARVDEIEAALDADVRVRRLGDRHDPSDGAWADAIVLAGQYLREAPWATGAGKPLLVDLSCWDFETQIQSSHVGVFRNSGVMGIHTHRLLETLGRADMVAVRDQDQRDAALGLLAGCGRLSDLVYDEDASLRTIIDILDARQVAEWCLHPRRAADLVRTYVRPTKPKPTGMALAAQELPARVQRAIGRGNR